jgi:hypothetical protein
MKDVIVDEVRRTREKLIERFGRIDGYFKHCQAQDRAHAGRTKARRGKPKARVRRKTTKAT